MRLYDWKKHNKIKERELEIIFKEAIKIINDTKEPWTKKQYGRPPYSSKSMVLICLIKVYFRMPYRDIESLIRSNKTFQEMLKLNHVPDYNTTQRAMAKIPLDYLQNLNQRLTFVFKKSKMILPLMQQALV